MNELTAYLDDLESFINESFDSLSAEEQNSILDTYEAVLDKVSQPKSNDAQLLWILSGGNEDAFINYLSEYQTPETRGLLANPTQLQQTIDNLKNENTHGVFPADNLSAIPEQKNGIPRAQLRSSNVFGSLYNPQSGKLKVQFHEGGLYEYDNISPLIARLFQSGDASAKTKGQNKFGKWWISKKPSLGSSVWKYLRNANVPYRKVA